ncbi:MAG TPA: dUTP diphosphatase [Lachnospiraceae bacterium]|nr:dUTP diphosphatase [Lachnospiraceae bacterium]
MVNVKIKKLTETAKIPTKAHVEDAAFDLYADIPNDTFIPWGSTEERKGLKILPHTTVKIGTGVAMAIPNGYWGAIYARSGIATKQGLRPANAVGVADSNYRGEIIVALHNDSSETQIVEHGQRIAQFMLAPVIPTEFEETNNLDETSRGAEGFGDSGKF